MPKLPSFQIGPKAQRMLEEIAVSKSGVKIVFSWSSVGIAWGVFLYDACDQDIEEFGPTIHKAVAAAYRKWKELQK